MNKKPSSKLPDDSMFSIKISESMEIRNSLRSGLFEAQGKDSNKIPLFVSWPSWLEDGIVCIYANDLHALLSKTVRDTASSFSRLIDQPGEGSPDEVFTGEPEKTAIDKAREAARAILEQPLGKKPDTSEDMTGGTADIEPDESEGDDGGHESGIEEYPAITGGASTRDLAGAMLRLKDNKPKEGAGKQHPNHQQELADSLFKKYKKGGEQTEPV